MEKGKILCWVCEKSLNYKGLFTPTVQTTSGEATACRKCATQEWFYVGDEHKQGTAGYANFPQIRQCPI